jgi:hypothetical protein
VRPFRERELGHCERTGIVEASGKMYARTLIGRPGDERFS